MPAIPEPPFHRWGIRFTADETHDAAYLQDLHDNSPTSLYRGEMFLNEPLDEIYYTDSTGVVRKFGERTATPVPFDRIDFTGLREFADDAEAALGTPEVAVGGLYHTSGAIKIRLV